LVFLSSKLSKSSKRNGPYPSFTSCEISLQACTFECIQKEGFNFKKSSLMCLFLLSIWYILRQIYLMVFIFLSLATFRWPFFAVLPVDSRQGTTPKCGREIASEKPTTSQEI
jgi:hypothetical protein